MPVPDQLADEILVKCARHCCICRRYRPLHLQVHHIKPREDGGGDEPDNLIAVCLLCHCDVHTQTLFTRRFSMAELKGHRDAVYRLVAEGKLPIAEIPGAHERAVAGASQLGNVELEREVTLTPTESEILVTAADGKGHEQGLVEVTHFQIQMGSKTIIFADQREGARYKEAFHRLRQCGVFDGVSGGYGAGAQFYLNAEGYRWVDQLLALASRN
jgi:HNH endonuclease